MSVSFLGFHYNDKEIIGESAINGETHAFPMGPSGNSIWLDINAGGWGWFVDPTPADDSEFTTAGNQGEMNDIDILTVLMHEIGHLLGYQHTDGGVMNETLELGIREALVDQIFTIA